MRLPLPLSDIPVVLTPDEASRAIAAGAEFLRSPEDGALIWGLLWFAEVQRALEAAGIDRPIIIDCADRADLVVEAFRLGFRYVAFSGEAPQRRKLAMIAEAAGGCLVGLKPVAARD